MINTRLRRRLEWSLFVFSGINRAMLAISSLSVIVALIKSQAHSPVEIPLFAACLAWWSLGRVVSDACQLWLEQSKKSF